jgi:hypothetical protein
MGGTTSTTNTSQQQKVELPAWVDQASQENYGLAKEVSGRPLAQFEGERVAAPSGMTTQGYGMLKDVAGTTNPLYGQAADVFKSGTGPLDINQYLNPYTSEVENNAIRNANTSLDQQLRGVSDSAQKAHAFGGSRAAVESGVTRAEGVKSIGDLSASLRKAGFDTATQTALNDRTGRMAAAQGLLGSADMMDTRKLSNISALIGAGQQDQAQRQKTIDAAMAKFDEAKNYPVEQLNMRLAALGMSPYGKTTTGTGTSSTETPTDWATVGLGALKSAPGIIGSAAGGGSGLLGLLALSDRDSKTDIQKVSDGEIPMYAYRYKGDPKTYPKIVGPMAQDIEKKYPKAIKKVGRYKAIDINNLMEVLS